MADSPTERPAPSDSADRTYMLLRLLAEYSGKLRSMCDESARWRQREETWITAGGVVVICVIVLSWLLPVFFASSRPQDVFIAGFLIGSLVAILFVWTAHRSRQRRKPLDYDIRVLVRQLKHLVRIASQREQHVESDHSRRLELDLRLTDAEGALAYGEGIVGKDDLTELAEDLPEALRESEKPAPTTSGARGQRAPMPR